jgi:hypothetical protein
MNIVDSLGWLAYFADEPSAKHFKRNRYYVPGSEMGISLVEWVWQAIRGAA